MAKAHFVLQPLRCSAERLEFDRAARFSPSSSDTNLIPFDVSPARRTMVDNRYATALVISCVLSILATVYLSVAIGTQHWYQYSSPTVRGEANVSELRSLYEEFIDGEFDEKTYSDTLFRLNGTVGLWWRCVLVPTNAQWYKEPGKCAEPLAFHSEHSFVRSRVQQGLSFQFSPCVGHSQSTIVRHVLTTNSRDSGTP